MATLRELITPFARAEWVRAMHWASWWKAESFECLSVEDERLGIANGESPFVPLCTPKPNGSGPGSAQQTARAHGGEFHLVNREDGAGARATLRLPLD